LLIDPETHVLDSYSSKPDIFVSPVWNYMAKKYKFKKLYFTTKPSQDEIKAKTSFAKFKVLHETDTTMLVVSRNMKCKKVTVLQDGKHSNRYFVGISFQGYCYTDYIIMGMFVYCGEDGSTEVKISSEVHCFDLRDEFWGHLYNQTLLFVEKHRDHSQLRMFVKLLDYNDDIVLQSRSETKIVKTFDGGVVPNGRYMMITTKDKQQLYIDLGSVRNDNNRIYLAYSTAESTEEEQVYGDGYPETCIKCGKATHAAMLRSYNNSCYNTGNSCCIDCMIRYSQSEKRWVCCLFRQPIDKWRSDMTCGNPIVDAKFVCNRQHVVPKKIEETQGIVKRKHPFRKLFNIYEAPIGDANAQADQAA